MQACRLARTSDDTLERDVLQARGPVLLVVPLGSCRSCRLGSLPGGDASGIRCYCLTEGSCGVLETYAVSYRPTVLVFRDGKVIRRLIGEPLPDVIETVLRTEAAQGARRG